MNLVGYVRVSTDKQLDAYGPETQMADINRWAAQNGSKVVYWAEDAITGTSDLEDREGLEMALKVCEEGGADGIIVARMDRLARKLTTQEAILGQIWRQEITLIDAQVGVVEEDDPDDPMRTMIRQVLGAMAEFDRASTVARMRKGLRAKSAKGGYTGGHVGWGYTHKDDLVVPDERVLSYLLDVLAMRQAGHSYDRIADYLNGCGIPTPKGGDQGWTRVQVSRACKRYEEGLASETNNLHRASLKIREKLATHKVA